jgi:hypothetical protein
MPQPCGCVVPLPAPGSGALALPTTAVPASVLLAVQQYQLQVAPSALCRWSWPPPFLELSPSVRVLARVRPCMVLQAAGRCTRARRLTGASSAATACTRCCARAVRRYLHAIMLLDIPSWKMSSTMTLRHACCCTGCTEGRCQADEHRWRVVPATPAVCSEHDQYCVQGIPGFIAGHVGHALLAGAQAA